MPTEALPPEILPPEILVVCHANICRSPMVAAMLGHRLATMGVDATVSSAGLLHDGSPAAPLGVEVMAQRDLGLEAHRSRRVNARLVMQSDLVIAMERTQLREVVLLAPSAFPRCFTLKELVRRAELVGPRDANEALRDWLTRAHHGRTTSMLLGVDATDDVADPYGGTRTDFERTATEVELLIGQLTLLAWSKSDRDGS